MEHTSASGIDRFLESFSEPLDSKTRVHLKKLYGCMILALVTAAIGSAAHIITDPFKILICSLGAASFSFLLFTTSQRSEKQRLVYLFGFFLLSGIITGQIATGLFLIHSFTLPMVLISASIIFAAFAVMTFYASDRKGLYISGVILSLASTTVWMKTLDLISGSRFFFHLNLHTGLVFICAFVLYDTHNTLEQRAVEEDHIWHPVSLLWRVFAVSCRFLATIFFHTSKKNAAQSGRSANGEKDGYDRVIGDLQEDLRQQTSQIVTTIKGEVETLDKKVKELQKETKELKKMADGNQHM